MRFAFVIILGHLLPLVALAAAQFESPQMSISDCADTEASTNLVFDAGAVGENRWDMTFEVDGTAVNNAQVEFGCDADGDGSLSSHVITRRSKALSIGRFRRYQGGCGE